MHGRNKSIILPSAVLCADVNFLTFLDALIPDHTKNSYNNYRINYVGNFSSFIFSI